MERTAQEIGIFAFGLAGLVALVLFRGFVLASLWLWFVTPLGAPEIGVAHAIGLSGLVTLTMAGFATEKRAIGDDEGPWAHVMKAFAKPLFYCLFGWGMGAIVHGFM